MSSVNTPNCAWYRLSILFIFTNCLCQALSLDGRCPEIISKSMYAACVRLKEDNRAAYILGWLKGLSRSTFSMNWQIVWSEHLHQSFFNQQIQKILSTARRSSCTSPSTTAHTWMSEFDATCFTLSSRANVPLQFARTLSNCGA